MSEKPENTKQKTRGDKIAETVVFIIIVIILLAVAAMLGTYVGGYCAGAW